jgi:hypothetical protein
LKIAAPATRGDKPCLRIFHFSEPGERKQDGQSDFSLVDSGLLPEISMRCSTRPAFRPDPRSARPGAQFQVTGNPADAPGGGVPELSTPYGPRWCHRHVKFSDHELDATASRSLCPWTTETVICSSGSSGATQESSTIMMECCVNSLTVVTGTRAVRQGRCTCLADIQDLSLASGVPTATLAPQARHLTRRDPLRPLERAHAGCQHSDIPSQSEGH